jgi:GNAT superfamily N-acetyltransferase
MSEDPAARVHSAYVYALGRVGALAPGAVAENVGPFLCIDAGLGVSRFNVVVASGKVAQPKAELRAALDWFAERGLNARVDLRGTLDGGLMAAAMVEGLQFWRRELAMLLATLPFTAWKPALQIEPVTGANLEAYCEVEAEEFGDMELAMAIGERAMALDDATMFVGFDAGRPVARSMCIVRGAMVSVHNVYVAPSQRRKGFGSEVSRFALDVGRERGAKEASLEATPAGLGIYTAMGFRKVEEYVVMGTDEPISWR